MGCWGPEILDNDVSQDAATAYGEGRERGLSPGRACRGVVRQFAAEMQDSDDAPLVWLGLAMGQLADGRVEPLVFRHASAAISRALPLASPERRSALQELLQRLKTARASQPTGALATPRLRRRVVGDVVKIPLREDLYGFGRVLPNASYAFYDLFEEQAPGLEDIVARPVLFIIPVMQRALRRWSTMGNIALGSPAQHAHRFFRQDPLTGSLDIYANGVLTPATAADVVGLERLAVWDPEHVEERLRGHLAGRPNVWVEQLRYKG